MPQALLYQPLQTRFVDGDLTPPEAEDTLLHDIHGVYVMSEFREAGGGHETNVAGTNHRDAHTIVWTGETRACVAHETRPPGGSESIPRDRFRTVTVV